MKSSADIERGWACSTVQAFTSSRARICRISSAFLTVGFGVSACAARPATSPRRPERRFSATMGSSGMSAERFAVVTARARSKALTISRACCRTAVRTLPPPYAVPPRHDALVEHMHVVDLTLAAEVAREVGNRPGPSEADHTAFTTTISSLIDLTGGEDAPWPQRPLPPSRRRSRRVHRVLPEAGVDRRIRGLHDRGQRRRLAIQQQLRDMRGADGLVQHRDDLGDHDLPSALSQVPAPMSRPRDLGRATRSGRHSRAHGLRQGLAEASKPRRRRTAVITTLRMLSPLSRRSCPVARFPTLPDDDDLRTQPLTRSAIVGRR